MPFGTAGDRIGSRHFHLEPRRPGITKQPLIQTLYYGKSSCTRAISQARTRRPELLILGVSETQRGNTQKSICAVQSNNQPRRLRHYRSGKKSKPCRSCDGPFKQGHSDNCPAKTVTCRNCQKRGPSARVCRSAPALDRPNAPRNGQGKSRNLKTEQKRMRYVRHNVEKDEEGFGEHEWQPEAQVAHVTCSSLEDGKIGAGNNAEGRDVLPSGSSRDN